MYVGSTTLFFTVVKILSYQLNLMFDSNQIKQVALATVSDARVGLNDKHPSSNHFEMTTLNKDNLSLENQSKVDSNSIDESSSEIQPQGALQSMPTT
jgi:hypothetical protein